MWLFAQSVSVRTNYTYSSQLSFQADFFVFVYSRWAEGSGSVVGDSGQWGPYSQHWGRSDLTLQLHEPSGHAFLLVQTKARQQPRGAVYRLQV